jgi:hypothetical protein
MFLELYGSVYSWWTFVYEQLIGRLQRLRSNNKFGKTAFQYFEVSLIILFIGELEPTLLHTFIRASRLRRWLSRRNAPDAIKECATLLEKYLPKRPRGTAGDYIPMTTDMEVDMEEEADRTAEIVAQSVEEPLPDNIRKVISR